MKNRNLTRFVENLFLGAKYKKILTLLYVFIIFLAFSYLAGKACGNALYYLSN